jgi:hypothetical protein
MKPIFFGAVLALLWLAFGLPLATPFGGVANLVQPVTIAFVLGVLARPHLTRGRTT